MEVRSWKREGGSQKLKREVRSGERGLTARRKRKIQKREVIARSEKWEVRVGCEKSEQIMGKEK